MHRVSTFIKHKVASKVRALARSSSIALKPKADGGDVFEAAAAAVRAVATKGAGWVLVPLSDFGRSVTPISTGGILCPPHYYVPPGFLDLPMALLLLYVDVVVRDAVSEDGNARWAI